MEITLINQQDEAYAKEKLTQYYEDNLIPAEKKAYLTELDHNAGPYMGIESQSGETHYLMDAASQIATLGLGFSPSVFMGVAHHLASWTNNPHNPQFLKIKDALHSFLMRKTGWSQLDLTLCNSGAESNEIALGYAYRRRQNKEATKVLAFEGSFHGRMLISLFSTWNKTKREPFQRTGYETLFNDYPELSGADINKECPKEWKSLWDQAPLKEFAPLKEWSESGDAVLKSEVDCLMQMREKLLKGDIFAVIIEPMQCEGGDRYASDRFHTALLLMARSFGVSVIYDEVQTGFHLGREFFWHRHFKLEDSMGRSLVPDYLICAKKAQVGMVLSPRDLQRTTLEKREQFQVASAIRGYYHGLALDQSRDKIIAIEEYVAKKLDSLLSSFSEHLSRPRVLGLSFAFEVDSAENVMTYISKRFNHGLLYYPAGAKTLRFRLNTSYTFEDIDFLFERLNAISEEIYKGASFDFNGKAKTKARNLDNITRWQHILLEQRLKEKDHKSSSEEELISTWKSALKEAVSQELKDKIDLIAITKENFATYKENVDRIQKEVYEPTRQTSIERFEKCAHSDFGINLGILIEGKLEAIAFASSLKDHPLERGIRQDPDFTNPKALYMIDTTVTKELQSFGMGRLLKYALTSIAVNRGYDFIKGRNRDKLAAAMLNINLSLGSFEQFFLREDYPDFEEYRDVLYYDCPLSWEKGTAELGNRINGLIANSDIDSAFMKAQLPYLTNKVCLSNFVSETFLSHVKAILSQLPSAIRHGYTASGQSECVDKIFKSFMYNNKERFDNKKAFLTFEGHYFGQGSFLSRSISHGEDSPYFPVEKLPHPTKENKVSVLSAMEELFKNDQVSSLWLEPLCQLTYERIDDDLLKEIKALCEKYSIALVFNETASQAYSHHDDAYFVSSLITPDATMAFLGGQAAIVGLKEEHFVAKPLMMISTWDGDEHAFASYHKGMNQILEHKEEFISLKEKFNDKIISQVGRFSGVSHNIRKGKGLITGNLSQELKDKLQETPEGYVVDATFSNMKAYCE